MANIGDKYIIEIDDKVLVDSATEDNPRNLYTVKGFNTLVFDDFGLNKLEKYEEDEAKNNTNCIDCDWIKITYRDGMAHAWNIARELMRGRQDGGMSIEELQKVFGETYWVDIIARFTPEEVEEKLRDRDEILRDKPPASLLELCEHYSGEQLRTWLDSVLAFQDLPRYMLSPLNIPKEDNA